MNRYQIAVHKDAKQVLQLKKSVGPVLLYDYLKACIRDKMDFDATLIPDGILEQTLVKLSTEYDVPLLTGSIRRAQLLRIAYSHKSVYTPLTLPKNNLKVICLPDVSPIPNGLKPILITKNKG